MEVGHCDIATSHPGESETDFIIRIIEATRRSGYAFPISTPGAIGFAFPRSVDWNTLDQFEFSPIANAIYAIIEAVLKVPIKEIFHETGHASTKDQSRRRSRID